MIRDNYIVSFCLYYRDPAPNSEPTELKPIQGDVINYVDITNNGLFVDVNPHIESIQFWNELLSKHRETLNVKF